jgi:endonuclease/exonuclease/phosphatase (EEP) superfamily protein YafD
VTGIAKHGAPRAIGGTIPSLATSITASGLISITRRLTTWLSTLLTIAAGVAVCSQVRRTSGSRPVALLQTLTPHLTIAMMPVAVVAVRRRQVPTAVAAALVGAGGATLLAPVIAPSRRGERERHHPDDAVRIATVNLLYTNQRSSAIADDLLDRSFDVIVFTEYTAHHRALLDAHHLVDHYPYRIDREGPRALGLAIWSRLPLAANEPIPTINHSIDVTVDTLGGQLRVVGVHTPTPVYDFAEWEQDLVTIRGAARQPAGPTLVTGDFNATHWHPGFRGILEEGYDDAHAALGRGLCSTWPIGKRVPPFALLDHALIGGGLVATAIEHFPVAGSDHRGVVVTVSAARRAAPRRPDRDVTPRASVRVTSQRR